MPWGEGYAKTMGLFTEGYGYDLKLLLNLAPHIPQNKIKESGEGFSVFLVARLNIFTSGGIVYTSKVFLPNGPLMLGFNKVYYCLK